MEMRHFYLYSLETVSRNFEISPVFPTHPNFSSAHSRLLLAHLALFEVT
jgi:hypothetical protein